MTHIGSFDLKFIKKEKIAKNTFNFFFTKPGNLVFLPGQYLKLKLDIDEPDTRGDLRYFTISSSPAEELLVITTGIIRSSFKKRMAGLLPGESVSVRGPFGSFVLDKNSKSENVMISSGKGITPFRSMIVGSNNDSLGISLIASFEKKDEYIFQKELEEIAKKRTNVKVFFVDRQNTRINIKSIVKEKVEKSKESVYYIAGAQSFVSSISNLLKRLGVGRNKIRTEDFPGYTR